MLLAGLLAAALSAAPSSSPSVAPPAAPVAVGPPTAPGPDGIELAGPELGAVREPSAPGAWGGARTGKESTLSDRVASYTLRAVLDPAKHTVDGTERLGWRNRSAVPVRSLYLHLYLNAFESEGSVFALERHRHGAFRTGVETEDGEWGYVELHTVKQAGRDATWTFVHPDGGPDTDHTVVRVDLPEAVPPGGTTALDLTFLDRLPRVVARTGWFDTFHIVGQWFPKVGVLELPGERGATRPRWNCHEFHLNSEFYADFGSYDLEVVAPEGYTVAAVGARIGTPGKAEGGLSHRFHADDVHDVAFVAWNGFAPPLEATWTGQGSPTVKVQVLYPPEYARQAQESLKADLDSIEFFSRTLGPYPYSTSTVVIPPFNAEESAGMEYETFFTGGAANHGLYSAVGLARFVVVHEFGHGYFMGLLASNEFEEPFLDEGMNEWWDMRMMGDEEMLLEPSPLARILGFDGMRFTLWDEERVGGSIRHAADPIAANSWQRWSEGSYATIYARSSTGFHDLTALVGEETAARAMKLYYERWRFRHPSTGDLGEAWRDAAPDAPTRAVIARWFEDQVYAASPVDDRVVSVESEEVLPFLGYEAQDGKRVELVEKDHAKRVKEARASWTKEHGKPEEEKPGPFPFRTVVSARRYAYHVPRAVEVTFEDGSVETLDWPPGERWARWQLVRPVKARQARLVPAERFQLDLDRFDDGRTREAQHGTSTRIALYVEGWLRLALSLLETL